LKRKSSSRFNKSASITKVSIGFKDLGMNL
jgi:hypothetical protein